MIEVKCRINGNDQVLKGHAMARLLDVLREQDNLTGTKEGCGEGECGACSIIVNGRLVNSCLVPLIQAQGADIRTVEGLAAGDGTLHVVQQAFLECGGAQCGMCTPGMLMAAVHLLEKTPQPNPEDIQQGLAGNLCRCTGYTKIFDSVRRAATAEKTP